MGAIPTQVTCLWNLFSQDLGKFSENIILNTSVFGSNQITFFILKKINIFSWLLLNLFHQLPVLYLIFVILLPGKQLIDTLLNDYLFPASKLILESSSNPDKLNPQAEYNPK